MFSYYDTILPNNCRNSLLTSASLPAEYFKISHLIYPPNYRVVIYRYAAVYHSNRVDYCYNVACCCPLSRCNSWLQDRTNDFVGEFVNSQSRLIRPPNKMIIIDSVEDGVSGAELRFRSLPWKSNHKINSREVRYFARTYS